MIAIIYCFLPDVGAHAGRLPREDHLAVEVYAGAGRLHRARVQGLHHAIVLSCDVGGRGLLRAGGLDRVRGLCRAEGGRGGWPQHY